MSDPIAEDLISGYVDDELDGPSRAAVEAAIAETPAMGDVLIEVVEAREAVRLLPMLDPRRGVLDGIIATVAAADPVVSGRAADAVPDPAGPTAVHGGTATNAPVVSAAPVDELVQARRRRRFRVERWLAGGAAAAVLLGVLIASPQPNQVTPTVGRLVDNHAARASDDSDPTSQLATLAVAAPMALFR